MNRPYVMVAYLFVALLSMASCTSESGDQSSSAQAPESQPTQGPEIDDPVRREEIATADPPSADIPTGRLATVATPGGRTATTPGVGPGPSTFLLDEHCTAAELSNGDVIGLIWPERYAREDEAGEAVVWSDPRSGEKVELRDGDSIHLGAVLALGTTDFIVQPHPDCPGNIHLVVGIQKLDS